jgi:hypothetical protein
MRYLLLVHLDEARWAELSPEEADRRSAECEAFRDRLKQAGAHVASQRLRPTPTATTIRVRNAEVLTTDGPFAETKEQLAGFYMIDAADLDEAVAWAAQVPPAAYGSVEVRPVWE